MQTLISSAWFNVKLILVQSSLKMCADFFFDFSVSRVRKSPSLPFAHFVVLVVLVALSAAC